MKERKDWHKSKGYYNSKDRGQVNKELDMRDNSLKGQDNPVRQTKRETNKRRKHIRNLAQQPGK